MGKNSQNPKLLRQFSAGGIVFKNNLWLVTRSTSSELYPKGFWRLPKGWIDNNGENIPGPITKGEKRAKEEELRASALREVKEEGGVIAKIVSKVGSFKYFLNLKDQKILKFVTFYLMEYTKDSSEGHDWETAEILWLPYEDAIKKLDFSGEKEALKKTKEILDKKI